MPSALKKPCNGYILLVIIFFFVSCGTLKTTGNKEKIHSDGKRVSQLDGQVTDLKQDLSVLTEKMSDKDKQIQALSEDIQLLKQEIFNLSNPREAQVTARQDPLNPGSMYTKARNLLMEENYQDAASLFTDFYQTFSAHSLADNAVYWLGECHYSLGEYKQSISVFKQMITQYPKSEKIPDALLKIGYAYLSMDDSNRAHHYLKQVLKEYPFSLAAEKAQGKLGDFK